MKYLDQLTAVLTAVNTITTGEPLVVRHFRNKNAINRSICGRDIRPDQCVDDPARVTCTECLDIEIELHENRLWEYRDEAIIARDMREHPEDYRDE